MEKNINSITTTEKPTQNPPPASEIDHKEDFIKQLSHPFLSSPDHPIINCFKNLIPANFELDPGNFGLIKQFSQLIFNGASPQQLNQLYQEKGLSFDAVCGKIIPKNVAFYMCLDCDKLRKVDSSIVCCLCRECFLHSDHKGHRLLLSKNTDDMSSACDCGDSSSFEPQGFCKSHSRKTASLELIIQGLGVELTSKLKEVMLITFYGIFSLIEIQYQLFKYATDKEKGPWFNGLALNLNKIIDYVANSILYFLDTLITKINSSFIPVISDILQSKLPEGFNLSMHNCQEYKKPIYTGVSSQCSCTIMELVTKYISSFLPNFQENLISFCNNIGKHEEFKAYMSVTFMKSLYFLFYQDDPILRKKEAFANFERSNIHFYTSVAFCELVVKSPAIQNLFDLYSDIIEHYKTPDSGFFHIMSELKAITKCLLRPNSTPCHILLYEKRISNIFLDLMTKHAYLHIYPGPIFPEMTSQDLNLSYIIQVMAVSGFLDCIFKRSIVQLEELLQEERENILRDTHAKWKEHFIDYVQHQRAKDITFIPMLERAANYLIRGPDLNITKEKVYQFLEKISGMENISKNAELLLQGTLVQMGVIRRIYLLDERTKREIGYIYFQDEFTFIDADTTSIQMLLPWISSDIIFPSLVSNWFHYSNEIKEFVLKGNSQKLTKDSWTALEDFLGLLIYWMIDEISILKLKLTKDPRNYNEEVASTQDLNRVTRKVLISLTATRYWIDINMVKETLKSMLWESNIENVLPELMLKDEKANKIRLKEEYYDQVDPFLFSHKRLIQKDLLSSLEEDDQKKHKLDTVSGVYYTDLPYYCYEIQQSIFQSDLPVFLVRFIMTYDNDNVLLLRPVLRLILLHFQCVSHLQTKGANLIHLKKSLQNYLTKEFETCLEKIRENESLSDYHMIVRKIIDFMKKNYDTNETSKIEIETEETLTEESPALKKKKMAEQKMKQLKEQFLKKQQAFLANAEKIEEEKILETSSIKEESKEEVESQCTLCLHKINTVNELYGSPYYINFANNFNHQYFKVSKTFAVLHGCGHIFHQKCFKDWSAKTRQEQGPYQILLNKEETYCPLCSNLVNEFCNFNVVEQEVKDEDEKGTSKEKEEQQILKRLGATSIFIRTQDPEIYKINDPERIQGIILEGIYALKDMLYMFLETMKTANFESFVKRFKLHVDFFSCVKKQVQNDSSLFAKALNDLQKDEGINLTLESFLIMELVHDILLKNPTREYIIEKIFCYFNLKIDEGLKQSEMVPEEKYEFMTTIFKDEEQKEILFSELKPLLQKGIVIIAFSDHLYGNHVSSLELINSLEDIQNKEINYYLPAFGIENISAFTSLLLKSEKENQTPYTNLQIKDNASKDFRFFVPTGFKPTRISLPRNYQAFLDEYMKKTCVYCKDLPGHGEKLLCLLCGEVLCKTRCTKKGFNLQLGNANFHTFSHCENGFYLDLYLLGLIYINFPKNIIARKRALYLNESGHTITNLIVNGFDKRLDVLDFKSFTLNDDTVEYIDSVVENYTIPLELFLNARSNAKLYVDGIL